MAVITLASSSGLAGEAVLITLNKNELVEIVTDPYYEDQAVWNRVYAIISSNGQSEQVDITSGSGIFQTSAQAKKGDWSLESVNIADFDGGTLRLTENLGTVAFTMLAPDKPTITSPTDAATGVTFPLTITSSAYNVTGETNDTHTQSDWVVKDSAGDTVFSSRDDSSNLESISVPETGFSTSTTYYARVRHTGGTYGDSQWSDNVEFTTASAFSYFIMANGAEKSYTIDGNTITEQGSFSPSITDRATYTKFSEDGNYLIVCSQSTNSVYVYERSGDSFTQMTFPNSFTSPGRVGINSDGSIALVGDGSNLYKITRSGSTWTSQGTFGSWTEPGDFNFAPNSTASSGMVVIPDYINSSTSSNFYVYSINTSTQSSIFTGSGLAFHTTKFSPDGNWIVAMDVFSGTGKAKSYSVSGTTVTFNSTFDIDTSTATVYDFAWSPDSTKIVALGWSSSNSSLTTRSGSTFTSASIALDHHLNYQVTWSSDGNYIATGGGGNSYVYKWNGDDTVTALTLPEAFPGNSIDFYSVS